MKKIFMKCGTVIASFAFFYTSFIMNATCALYAYQPELPENAKKLIKSNNFKEI